MSRSWYVGLDVGSTVIAAAIASPGTDTRPGVVERGIVPSAGVARGRIVDPVSLQHSLMPLLAWISRSTDHRPTSIALSIPGAVVRSLPSTASIAHTHPMTLDYQILDDARREALRAPSLAGPVLASVPTSFEVDGRYVDRSPVGQVAGSIKVSYRTWVVPSRQIEEYSKVLSQMALMPGLLQPRAVAAAASSMHETERRLGAVLIDIGGETTDVAVYVDNQLADLFSIPMGGTAITHDIATLLGIDYRVAEQLKRDLSREAGSTKRIEFARAAARARALELLSLVRAQLDARDLTWKVPSGVVLSGGGASLAGIVSIARQALELPARLAQPGAFGDVTWSEDPSLASLLGCVEAQWLVDRAQALTQDRVPRGLIDESTDRESTYEAEPQQGGFIPAFGRWLKEFVPHGETV